MGDEIVQYIFISDPCSTRAERQTFELVQLSDELKNAIQWNPVGLPRAHGGSWRGRNFACLKLWYSQSEKLSNNNLRHAYTVNYKESIIYYSIVI